MKLTRHNRRSGKNGVYNPLHNDRNFDISNSDHIDEERANQNIYWDCFNGFRQLKPKTDETLAETFADVEDLYYSSRYRDHIEGQCARNEKNRHPERNRTTTDLRKNKKTYPEETLFQIGTIDNHVSGEVLVTVVAEFIAEWQKRFGDYVHVLNWSLHMAEGTPHIHERHVFDCENQYGEIAPQQEKALEKLGFELPDPTKKPSKTNNRKITFDSACRAMFFDICKKHGLQLEEEPEYGGRAYLEKQDYILMKQKEQLAQQGQTISERFEKINHNRLTISQQNQKIDELTLKLDDVESLIDEVTDVAYDKAVEIVADTVRVETHKEDIQLIENTKKWLGSPERKAPKKERDYAVARLDNVAQKISKAMETALGKLRVWLMKPEVKKAGKEAIKNSARTSILAKLRENREKVDAENKAGQAQQKKQNMEL
ncbi:MAG: plasmid recombination protein [Clostridiales bacterium]|nr:plasmid recombination protein [Clostridiales bacterium]